ncbi:thiol:disulfide interchange protein precursor [compost metagenome]
MANIAGSATSELTPQAGKWEAYSQAKVEQRLGNGKTVFVDFTAAWCVTCQVNKKLVLNTDEIDQAFEQSGVVKMRADWTNRDPEITRALAHYGRSAVPMYLVLRPGQSPELLPELLTKSLVKASLASPVSPDSESSKPILGIL